MIDCERDAALLVPGYTGSKEDFLAILDLLADDSRHVIAIDMRGQFETAPADDLAGYAAAALGSDAPGARPAARRTRPGPGLPSVTGLGAGASAHSWSITDSITSRRSE